MSSLETRKARPEDSKGLSALYSVVYGASFDSSYWDWKYFHNAFGDHMMYVALDGENVVGEVGAIPVRVRCCGENHFSSQTCDIVVLPEYQKRGAFLKLYKLSNNENVERRSLLCYGFSVPVTLKISSRLLKFRPVCQVWRWVLVLNPAPYVARKVNFLPIAGVLSPIGRMYARLRLRKHYREPSGSVVEVERFDERFDRFWEERKDDHNIMVQRDSVYLNWRYSDHPVNQYKVMTYSEGGHMKGFIVLATVQEEVKRGFIMELLVEPGDAGGVDVLLSAAVDYFMGENTDVVTAWLPETDPLAGEFERWRFVKRETQHHLIVKIFGPEDEVDHKYIMDPANWFFSMGDSDYH